MLVRRQRDLIESAATERMTAQKPEQGKRSSAQGTVKRNRGDGVVGASGLKSTSAHAERVHRGRQPVLVERESGEQKTGHNAGFAAIGTVLVRAARTASEFACVRIRTISASSFVNSILSTTRRG